MRGIRHLHLPLRRGACFFGGGGASRRIGGGGGGGIGGGGGELGGVYAAPALLPCAVGVGTGERGSPDAVAWERDSAGRLARRLAGSRGRRRGGI